MKKLFAKTAVLRDELTYCILSECLLPSSKIKVMFHHWFWATNWFLMLLRGKVSVSDLAECE